jgi:tetratricopeptide (TPR) repeat protein
MAVLILILSATGVSLALTVMYVGPRPDIMVPVAATGLIFFLGVEISQRRKKSKNGLVEIRRLLLEEVSNIRKSPSKNRLDEFASQAGIQLDEYLVSLAQGSIMNQGLQALMEQDYETAVKLFKVNAKVELREAAASWFFEGNALCFLGSYEEALTAYRKATCFNPRFANAWYNWGVILEVLGRPEKAMEKYQEAIECDPGIAGAMDNLDGTSEEPGRLEKDRAENTQQLELNTGFAAAGDNSDVTLEDSERSEKQMTEYPKQLELNTGFDII